MDKGGGWIKIYRQIRENWIWEDPEKLKAWIDLLLMVNHEDKKILVNGKLTTIKRGSTLTSIGKLSERWNWSKNKVYRFLELLKADGMCNANGSGVGTTLTIVNYSNFQGGQNADGSSNESPNGSADGSPVGTQTRRNKNYKETKNARARGVYFENQRKDDLDGDVLKNILGRLNANGEITKAVSGDE